ncbi:uncharacterized protein DS421_6g174270 [Arachis hypogaea]|nr:uncharacterized protein DS421_6g174270 [Arachis hypogaea]
MVTCFFLFYFCSFFFCQMDWTTPNPRHYIHTPMYYTLTQLTHTHYMGVHINGSIFLQEDLNPVQLYRRHTK